MHLFNSIKAPKRANIQAKNHKKYNPNVHYASIDHMTQEASIGGMIYFIKSYDISGHHLL